MVSSIDRICDSGTLATICTVSSIKWIGQNLAAGITGANLTLAAGGELRHSERKDWVTIALTGTLDVSGALRANVKSLQADTVRIRSGGSIVGTVGAPDAVNFPGITGTTTVTVDAGGLINADGAGRDGGRSNTSSAATGRYRRLATGGGAGGGAWGGDTGGGGGHGGAGGSGGGGGGRIALTRGGGGGGRIALTRGGGAAAFGGTLQVSGGAGQGSGVAGAAGTTYQP